jgi:succinate-semialdehyde dehydrogenase/glutarate-semialdehyde dehydrogenase
MPVFTLKDKTLLRGQCFVNGRWIDGAPGAAINVTNPATGEVIGTVPWLGAAETRVAIEAANIAYPAWRGRPAAERSALLRRWFELILENQEDLAVLMTAEQG